MAGLSRKEALRVIAHVEPQGVRVTPIRDGVLLRMPDGESTAVHFSGSDHRGPANLRAKLKRSGITWPTDGTTRQRYRASKPTIANGDLALSRLGSPETVTTAEMLAAWPVSEDGKTATRITVARYMDQAGYELVGHSRTARWVRCEIPERYRLAEDDNPTDEQDNPDTATDGLAVSTDGDLEFIDSRDSWTLDLDAVAGVSVRDVQAVLAAAGVALELRVWRH